MTRPRPWLLIALAFVAFVSLGLPDGVLGVAWPSVRNTFGKPLSHLGILLACSTSAYLVSSFLGGQFVRAVGVGKLLLASGLMVAVALAGISLSPTWRGLVFFAAIGGLGGGAIDAGINTFAASRFSARVVNWLHACWGIGATTGPLLMTAVLARGLSWRVGYEVLAVALALLSLLFLFTLRLWTIAPDTPGEAPAATATISEAFRRPVVWMQSSLFLLYCGIESTAGQLLYSLLTESRGMPHTAAGLATGGYWASLTAGRVVFGQLAATLSRRMVLRIGLGLAPVAATMLWINGGTALSLAASALLGFALAPIFPTWISITPDRVGAYYAPQAVGFQVAAANIGIALIPGSIGVLARRQGLEVVCVFLVVASAVLLVMEEAVAARARGRGAAAETQRAE